MRKFLKAYNFVLICGFIILLVIKYAKYIIIEAGFMEHLQDYAQKVYSDKLHMFTLSSSVLYWILIYNWFIK